GAGPGGLRIPAHHHNQRRQTLLLLTDPTRPRSRETAIPGDARRPRATPADGAAASLRDEVQALVDELAHADRAHLTAEAGALDSAEGDLGGLGGDGVHMRHSDLEAGRDKIGS